MALSRKPIEIVESGKHHLLCKAEHWKRIYLKEIAKVRNGFAFSSADFSKTDGLPLIRIRDIDNISTIDKYKGIYSDDFIIRKGDILIGMDGDFKIAIWKGANALLNQRVCRIIPNSKMYDPRFLFLCLQPYLNAIHAETSSVTVKHLSSKTIEEIPLPFPSLSEQQAIVSKIEEIFSDLENGKQQLQTTLHQLKVYRQSLLKWAFEGKLTYRYVKEGELPKDWRWVKLGDIALKITDGEHITPRRTSEGYYLLSARNIQNGYIDLNDVDFIPKDEYERIIKRCNPEQGDILISCSGSIGRVCRVPSNLKFTMVRSVALVKFDWEKYSPKFYEYLFLSPLLQRQIEKSKKATAQANLFLGPIKNLDVIICSLKEQKRVIEELENKLTICDKIEETINQSLQHVETLKHSILKRAFEGKLI